MYIGDQKCDSMKPGLSKDRSGFFDTGFGKGCENMDAPPGYEVQRTFSLRRLLIPISALLLLLACVYVGLFAGVREELPVPPGARSVALGAAESKIISEWATNTNGSDAIYHLYVSTDSPTTLHDLLHASFAKRQWTIRDAPPPSTLPGVNTTFDAHKGSRWVAVLFGHPAGGDTPLARLIARSVPQGQSYYITAEIENKD